MSELNSSEKDTGLKELAGLVHEAWVSRKFNERLLGSLVFGAVITNCLDNINRISIALGTPEALDNILAKIPLFPDVPLFQTIDTAMTLALPLATTALLVGAGALVSKISFEEVGLVTPNKPTKDNLE